MANMYYEFSNGNEIEIIIEDWLVKLHFTNNITKTNTKINLHKDTFIEMINLLSSNKVFELLVKQTDEKYSLAS